MINDYIRTTYQDLKISFLHSAFESFKLKFSNGYIDKWEGNETEWGYASYDFEDCFTLPIEELMIAVLEAITNAGRSAEVHESCLNKIYEILSKYPTEELVKDLEEDEKEEFIAELNLVLENPKLQQA